MLGTCDNFALLAATDLGFTFLFLWHCPLRAAIGLRVGATSLGWVAVSHTCSWPGRLPSMLPSRGEVHDSSGDWQSTNPKPPASHVKGTNWLRTPVMGKSLLSSLRMGNKPPKLLDYKFKGSWVGILAAMTMLEREAFKEKRRYQSSFREASLSLWRTKLRT